MGTSACGGEAEAQKKAPTTPAVPSVTAAAKAFQEAVTNFDTTDGCPRPAGECWDKMQAVAKPARTLREAMNADKAVGPEFWTQAYVLLDKMEKGMAVGSDKITNRPDVLGSAHDLTDWLSEHPVQ
ncbi:hypothetical protein GCM10010329_78200 [Streptomyces spiroverticillatus]|uniref:Uncharacterized protein n=1 Tax=Streptomyces finlayi TaxID=67296 RepID=A0A919CEM0_9ACTN|nr:hypothetical protein [Streptomyces finlayi]GHA43647.1 hypothetical protein GCM10010329_78200 [Streptomyces spiroverticillatus]GHD13245.1 hypothetical protein GCM10010334_71150 [Streptomyces finlayi]